MNSPSNRLIKIILPKQAGVLQAQRVSCLRHLAARRRAKRRAAVCRSSAFFLALCSTSRISEPLYATVNCHKADSALCQLTLLSEATYRPHPAAVQAASNYSIN